MLRGSFLGSDFSALGLTLKSVSHGLAGGVLSSVQGGKFVHGFSAAGVAQFASGGIDLIGGEGFSAVRIAAAAVLGGTVSGISGGKFANGAVTGAFSRAFNDEPEIARRRRAAKNILLGEDETADVLTDKIVRHRLKLLSEELDALIADLSAITDPRDAASVFSNATYSSDFDEVYLQGVSDTVRSLKFVRAGIFIRRGLRGLDALGSAAIEAGLTRGAGRLLKTTGATGAASQLGPYQPNPYSRPTMQRTPSIGCADVAQCSVVWR